MTNLRSVIPLVVEGGFCIGCGACAAAPDSPLTMDVGTDGMYRPVDRATRSSIIGTDDLVPVALDVVCPFSNSAADEDELSTLDFGDGARHPAIGRHEAIWAGHVSDDDFRLAGTSGGMTTWIVAEALRTGEVDGVLHVRSDRSDDGTYSRYAVSTTVEQLLEGRGSRYHVQTLEEVMAVVRSTPGRYAVVGVPCFIKAVRLLSRNEQVIGDRIALTVSLVCGHLKSANFAKYLGWSVGIEPDQLEDMNYRAKIEGRPANRYAITATSKNGDIETRGVEKIPMSDWGIGLFKPSACDYCDDVVGETADVSCGDAWLPPFMSDWKGANVVVARSQLAVRLIEAGIERADLVLTPWTADDVAASQESGLRHRREGLAVRLAHRQQTGGYVPTKRVTPTPEQLDQPLGHRMMLREQISRRSHGAFEEALAAGDLRVFHAAMRPLVQKYQGSRSVTTLRRVASWLLYRVPVPVERFLRKVTRGRRFA